MKKLIASLSAIASICVLTASLALAAPSEAVPASAEQNPYFDVTKEDPFGNRSIAVLGDSISHGANAPEIYNDSYLALVKQSLWEEVGYENYGFASIENTMWNNSGTYREVHHTSWGSEWTEQRIDDNLGRFNLSASKKGSKLDFTVEKDYEYFTVYYEVNEDGGTFDVITDEGTVTVDTSKGLTDKIGRSEYIAFPASRSFTIEVSSEGKKVAINGVGYYNNTDGVVINNYASNGSKLIDVSDNILDFACQSGVLSWPTATTTAISSKTMPPIRRNSPRKSTISSKRFPKPAVRSLSTTCAGTVIPRTSSARSLAAWRRKPVDCMSAHRMPTAPRC